MENKNYQQLCKKNIQKNVETDRLDSKGEGPLDTSLLLADRNEWRLSSLSRQFAIS